jgi:hypothetical protein
MGVVVRSLGMMIDFNILFESFYLKLEDNLSPLVIK